MKSSEKYYTRFVQPLQTPQRREFSIAGGLYCVLYLSFPRFFMTEAQRQHRLRVIINFALVYLFWGSTYLGIALVVKDIPPTTMGAVRFTVAGACMLGWAWWRGSKIRLTRSDFWRLGTVGVLLLTFGNVTVGWAEQWVPTGLAALIVAVVPLWVLVIETGVLGSYRLSGRGLAGLGLGMAGLVVLLWPKLNATDSLGRAQLIGSLALIGASLSWATGSVLSHRWHFQVDSITAAAWQTFIAGVVNLGLTLSLGDLARAHWTPRGVGALAYLVVAGSFIGFSAYIWLLNHCPTQKVATYAYVNPVVAVFLGWLVLGEQVDRHILLGTLIVVGAVALVTSAKVTRPPEGARGALGQPEIPAPETVGD